MYYRHVSLVSITLKVGMRPHADDARRQTINKREESSARAPLHDEAERVMPLHSHVRALPRPHGAHARRSKRRRL